MHSKQRQIASIIGHHFVRETIVVWISVATESTVKLWIRHGHGMIYKARIRAFYCPIQSEILISLTLKALNWLVVM